MGARRRRLLLRGALYKLLELQLARECERVRAMGRVVAAVGRLPQGLAGAQDEGGLKVEGGEGVGTVWWRARGCGLKAEAPDAQGQHSPHAVASTPRLTQGAIICILFEVSALS